MHRFLISSTEGQSFSHLIKLVKGALRETDFLTVVDRGLVKNKSKKM